GCLLVRKGVPTRNGVSKHRIIDGAKAAESMMQACTYHGRVLENDSIIVPKCTLQTKLMDAWCGELGDSFIVTLRIRTTPPSLTDRLNTVQETGYRALFAANWGVRPTRS
ncbi:hypothetical protein BJ875DRAFT_349240, partial [Amylocarpus encephaloides]